MIRFYSLLLLLSVLLPTSLVAQLRWERPDSLNQRLPAGINFYETRDPLAEGVATHAVYVRAALGSDDFDFSTVVAEDGATALTPLQFAEADFTRNRDSIYVAINGGFFSASQSLSLAIDRGRLLTPNVRALTRPFNGVDTTYYPTRGAFGIRSDGTADLGWVYTTPEGNTFRYPAPADLALGRAPLPQPGAEFPAGARAWEVMTALGGSPVLVTGGKLNITAGQELVDVENDSRQPRSAIGYTAEGEVILLVIDGRQSGFADGATLSELARIMIDLGCIAALNLDGGGSSGLVVNGRVANSPSDATGLRPVRTALLLHKTNAIYDTDQAPYYREPLGSWAVTGNPGFYGSSPARITPVATPATRAAEYTFTDLAPGRYRIGAWWVASGNRARNTPYVLRRGAVHAPDTVGYDQTTDDARFNPYVLADGTAVFDLSGRDTLRITNDANGEGTTVFATVDAIKLERVGDPTPLSFAFLDDRPILAGRLDVVTRQLAVRSVNSGVTFKGLTLGTLEADGSFDSRIVYDTPEARYRDTITVEVDIASLKLTGSNQLAAELFDNLGRRYLATLPLTVAEDVAILFPPADADTLSRPADLDFTQQVTVRRFVPTTSTDSVFVFRGGAAGAVQIGSAQELGSDSLTFTFTDRSAATIGDTTEYTIGVRGDGDRQFSRSLYVVAQDAPPAVTLTGDTVSRYRADGDTLRVGVSVSSQRASDALSRLEVYALVAGDSSLVATYSLTGQADEVTITYPVAGTPGNEVRLLARVRTLGGRTATASYRFTVSPRRGDTRMVVISDFNASFGSVTYEWQVDSIIQRIPRLWSPDMIVCGGDMIAGQSTALTPAEVDSMWAGFDRTVAEPIRAAGIPFLFTLGNHDGAIPVDIAAARRYWQDPAHYPGWVPVDTSHYPFYESFFGSEDREEFFVSWNAVDATISDEELDWVGEQLTSEAARGAKFRFVVGHLPLYAVANERNSAGNILNNSERLRQLLEENDVHTYVSGHHHAFYPAKRGALELMNAGAAGSGPRSWIGLDERSPNTVTLMDIFHADNPTYGKDTIVYTTYETAYRNADDMPVFEPEQLPEVIFSYNGEYQIRRDVAISTTASGQLSARNLREASEPAISSGSVSVGTTASGEGIRIEGDFADLRGRLLPEASAVALYRGRHTDAGELVATLEVDSRDGRNGTFSGSLARGVEMAELLSIGGYYVEVRTTLFPMGELRTQLYPVTNLAPAAPPFSDSLAGGPIPIRNEPAVLVQRWEQTTDPEVNPVTYVYELARDADFAAVVYRFGAGQANEVIIREDSLYSLAGAADALTLYRRVIATDGRNVSVGSANRLDLQRSDAPIEGDITLPAPDYRYDCTAGRDEFTGECRDAFARTGLANGHGVTVDRNGRVWAAAYSGGLRVSNPDGTPYRLSSDRLVYSDDSIPYLSSFLWKGDTVPARLIRGLGVTRDGNPLIVFQNSDLYKFDAVTGEPLVGWDGPTSLTNPTVDSLGRVFVTSVVGNRAFLLREQADSFTLARPEFTLPDRPAVVRASAISYDGHTIFLPSNGDANVNRYVAVDTGYVYLDSIPTGNSSNSIVTAPGGRVYVVVNRGQTPPQLVYRQYTADRTLGWQLSLDEVASTDLRGVALTGSRDTFYLVNSTDGSVERYRRGSGGEAVDRVDSIVNYTIPEVRPVDSLGRNLRAEEYVRLRGTVVTSNQAPTGLTFYLNQLGAGVQVYRGLSTFGYFPTVGDSLVVVGRLRQLAGQLRLDADSLQLVAKDRVVPAPTRGPSETREGTLVTVDSLTVDATTRTGGGYLGLRVATDGPVDLFIGSETELYDLPLPSGPFRVTGVLDQRDAEAPLTSGYLLRPLTAAAIEVYLGPRITAVSESGCSGEAVTFTATSAAYAGSAARYHWLLGDSLVATTLVPMYRADSVNYRDEWRVELRAAGDDLVYGLAAADSSETSGVSALPLDPRPEVLSLTYTSPAEVGSDIELIATVSGADSLRFLAPDGTDLVDGVIRDAELADAGVYRVIAVSAAGCESAPAEVTVTIERPSSIAGFSAELGLTLYPNPTAVDGRFALRFSQPLGQTTVLVQDAVGRQVSRLVVEGHPGDHFLVAPQTPGVYTVTVRSALRGTGSTLMVVR